MKNLTRAISILKYYLFFRSYICTLLIST